MDGCISIYDDGYTMFYRHSLSLTKTLISEKYYDKNEI